MKQVNVFIISFVLILMTALFAYDFFPNLSDFIYLPKPLLIVLLIIVFVFSIFSGRFQKDKDNQRLILLWQMVSTLYLLFLIVLFSVLGGVSQVGISLKNPVLWVVILISIYEIYNTKKKIKISNSNS